MSPVSPWAEDGEPKSCAPDASTDIPGLDFCTKRPTCRVSGFRGLGFQGFRVLGF